MPLQLLVCSVIRAHHRVFGAHLKSRLLARFQASKEAIQQPIGLPNSLHQMV